MTPIANAISNQMGFANNECNVLEDALIYTTTMVVELGVWAHLQPQPRKFVIYTQLLF